MGPQKCQKVVNTKCLKKKSGSNIPSGRNYPSMTLESSNLCISLSRPADYSGVQLQGCCSQSSLNSNGSLPGAGSHRGFPEQRVASWAGCFERLLQDPVGVRYFSVRKEQKFVKME